MEGARVVGWLPLIPLLPFLGFLLNAFFGRRGGRSFVSLVGVGAPLAGFALAASAFLALLLADQTVVVKVASPLPDHQHKTLRAVMDRLGAAGIPISGQTHEDRLEDIVRVGATPERTREVLRDFPDVTVGELGEVAPRSWYGPVTREGGAVRDIPWFSVGGFSSVFRFVFDRLSGLLCLVVLGVGSLIHVYSLGYMSGEDRAGFARYFAYLNLFTSMMLVLVLAGDLLLMFVGWEGVGLSSYLLIGFEYREGWKADAGIKAFVVNRVGDLGFILGVLALATAALQAGNGEADLRMDHLNALVLAGKVAPFTLGAAAACLFLGATGKSAQLPLYVWLPDAMAGPTPVSALIHAATMVTAGVYMVTRLHPVFEHAVLGGVPILGVVAIVGALTALFAATAACAQDDVKKVLAYSTVSQLGYMFIGAGVGAFGASVFHLVTHAFFKALLFLGAGSLIHATGTQDLKRMGGLRRILPLTFATMLVGAVALSGLPVPFLGGFFSKDMILGSAFEQASTHQHVGWWLVYVLGAVGGLLTAFYSTRLIAFAFLGKPGPAAEHAHESPPVMTYPLVILAVLTAVSGLLGLPALVGSAGDLLPRFLEPLAGGAPHGAETLTEAARHAAEGREVTAIAISVVAAIAGVFFGWSVYARGPMPTWAGEVEAGRGSLAPLRNLLANAWGVDSAYRRFIVEPVMETARGLWAVADDALLDRGLVDGAGRLARGFGELVTEVQSGRVARYAAYVAIGVIALLIASVV